jgi:hypothetical protein
MEPLSSPTLSALHTTISEGLAITIAYPTPLWRRYALLSSSFKLFPTPNPFDAPFLSLPQQLLPIPSPQTHPDSHLHCPNDLDHPKYLSVISYRPNPLPVTLLLAQYKNLLSPPLSLNSLLLPFQPFIFGVPPSLIISLTLQIHPTSTSHDVFHPKYHQTHPRQL